MENKCMVIAVTPKINIVIIKNWFSIWLLLSVNYFLK